MAMCKHFKSEAEGTNSKGMACRFECPKNADTLCNVPRPTPKLKRVKAWAHMHNDGKMEIFTMDVDKEYYSIPCTILIDAKYLKGKGKK